MAKMFFDGFRYRAKASSCFFLFGKTGEPRTRAGAAPAARAGAGATMPQPRCLRLMAGILERVWYYWGMEDLQEMPNAIGENWKLPENERGEPAEAQQSPENDSPQPESAPHDAAGEEQETGWRNPDGSFKAGHPNFGAGRPKGTLSITGEIKKKLEEMSPYLTTTGEKRTYLQALIDTILEEAIKNKDSMMIAKLWAYIDGLPRNTIDLRSEVVLEKLSAEQKGELVKLLKQPDA